MIIVSNKNKFAQEIIDILNTRGFGNLNKNDWEVLIFSLLKKYGNLQGAVSNHQISIELQMPETKVKRLAYEANLKYSSKNISDSFKVVLEKVTLIKKDDKIQFVIEDQFLKLGICAKLKELGHHADYSFNNEIVSMRIDVFVALMQELYPELKDIKTLKKIAKANNVKMRDGNSFDFKELLSNLSKDIASSTIVNLLTTIFLC